MITVSNYSIVHAGLLKSINFIGLHVNKTIGIVYDSMRKPGEFNSKVNDLNNNQYLIFHALHRQLFFYQNP